jgi:ankyrin repeat protein
MDVSSSVESIEVHTDTDVWESICKYITETGWDEDIMYKYVFAVENMCGVPCVDIQDKYGVTGLMFCLCTLTRDEIKRIVPRLLNSGVNPNVRADDGCTALMTAMEIPDAIDVFPILIEASDVNIQNRKGETALMVAVSNAKKMSNEDAVISLIKKGADVNITDKNGCHALMYATAYSGYASTEKTVMILIEAGSSINKCNDEGYSALMFAAQAVNTKSTEFTVDILLHKGADASIRNIYGYTAFDLHSIHSDDPLRIGCFGYIPKSEHAKLGYRLYIGSRIRARRSQVGPE